MQLHGCLGRGTYGAVLNASADGVGRVVLKLPVLRTWGFKFVRAEVRALQALNASIAVGGAGTNDNVVRWRGQSTQNTN